MKNYLTILFLACGIAAMPVVHAADETPAEQKAGQKAAGEDKDKKAAEDGKKNGEKKGEGGAEPECN